MALRWTVSQRFTAAIALVVLCLFPLAGRSIAGQAGTAATIIGQVTDESGAVLPGVTVTATSPALQVPQVTGVTDERGEYRLTPLPIGTYAVVYGSQAFSRIGARAYTPDGWIHRAPRHRHGRGRDPGNGDGLR